MNQPSSVTGFWHLYKLKVKDKKEFYSDKRMVLFSKDAEAALILNIIQTMYKFVTAWNMVSTQTIENYFGPAMFSPTSENIYYRPRCK